MAKDLVLLRYTDAKGERLAGLCRPREGVKTLRKIIGEKTPGDAEWFGTAHKSAIVIDTSGPVIITSAEDMTMLSFWFAMAATWLSQHGGGDV